MTDQHIDPDFDQLTDVVEGRHAGVFCPQQAAEDIYS